MTELATILVEILSKVGTSPEIEAALVALFKEANALIDQAKSGKPFDATAATARISNAAGQLANDEANADGALLERFPPTK